MNRIVVAGGRGFFGAAVVRILRAEGCVPLVASRRVGSDVLLDVEDPASIRKAIRTQDVIIDATAPFQTRTATLMDEAIEIGADVVDLSDSLDYARLAWTRHDDARSGGMRILNACSSVSVLSAFAAQFSGIRDPISIHGFLAPATRHTASPGAAASLLASVGRPIAVWRGGELQRARGWMESRPFDSIGRHGRLMEMADTFTLPRAYPSLRNVDFWVNPNTYGVGALLDIVSRMPALSAICGRFARYGTPVARLLGSDDGILAYEVESETGEHQTVALTGRESFLMAAIPAALAAIRLASGEPCAPGVVPVHQQVGMDALAAALSRHGISIETS